MTRLLPPEQVEGRGRDHGRFVPEQRLRQPLSDEARRLHAQALALFRSRQDAGFAPAAAA